MDGSSDESVVCPNYLLRLKTTLLLFTAIGTIGYRRQNYSLRNLGVFFESNKRRIEEGESYNTSNAIRYMSACSGCRE